VKQTSYPTPLRDLRPGDVVGCGLINDSFQRPRLFFTRNGKLAFLSPLVVQTYTALNPAFGASGHVELRTNDGSRGFAWDTAALERARVPWEGTIAEDGRGLIETIPEELLRVVLGHAVKSREAVTTSISVVSKQFNRLSAENFLWKPFFLRKWPNQSKDLKLKSWRQFYLKRLESIKKSPSGGHPIENCEFEFLCPMVVENMKKTWAADGTVFCDQCQKKVHKVETKEELQKASELGQCIAFYVRPRRVLMGLVC